jgi:calcineurin-like phosphoesterase family protein
MSRRFIISDTHLGHNNIEHFRKREDSYGELMRSEEQHELLYEELAKLAKRDTLFLLGDIAFDAKWLGKMKDLPCTTVLVCGNHDLDRKLSMSDLVDSYDKVYSLHKYKKTWLTHAPIHPTELRGKTCCHGHTHYHLMLNGDGTPDRRYKQVCAEYTGYKPITWEYMMSDEYYQECCKLHKEYVNLGYCVC